MAKLNVVSVLAVLLVACALISVEARPAATTADGDIKILKLNHIQDENSYKLEFENSDGQQRSEVGEVHAEEEGGIVVIGQYSFVTPENLRYTVQYKSSKDGFVPIITVTPA